MEEESGNEGEDRTTNAKHLDAKGVNGGGVLGQDQTPTSSSSKDDVQAASKDLTVYRYYISGGGRRKFVVFLIIISIFIGGSLVSR